jgi:retinol dehydrogenase-12
MIRNAAIFAAIVAIGSLLTSYQLGGRLASLYSPPYSTSDIPDLTGKYVLVTGGNSGIGKVTAKELARRGATVLATSRSSARADDALSEIQSEIGGKSTGSVEFLSLDLSSFKSVYKLAKVLKERGVKFDVVILNAGIMFGNYETTTEGFESQFGVNVLGHFFLVQLLLPKSLNSNCRIVHVSSEAHRFSYWEGIRFDRISSSDGYVSA